MNVNFKFDVAVLILLLSGSVLGCSSSSGIESDQLLIISMFGAFEAPPEAEGNNEPKYQSYELTDITMTTADGTEVIDLYDIEPKTVRIINRSQIIYDLDASDYEEEE